VAARVIAQQPDIGIPAVDGSWASGDRDEFASSIRIFLDYEQAAIND
jgi:hypothetical protein